MNMRLALSALLTIGVLGGIAWGYSEYRGLRSSLQDAREEVSGLRASLSNLQPSNVPAIAGACDRLSRANSSLADAVGRLERLSPVVALARNLPGLDQQAASGEALLLAANAAADSARLICEGLQPLQAEIIGGATVQQALHAMLSEQPTFERALVRARTAGEHLEGVGSRDLELLGDEAATAAAALREAVPTLRLSASMLVVAPRLLGADRERTYLILSQNSDELRPTGGFIGTAGLLRLRDGSISAFEYGPSSQFDTPPDLRVPPPEPLARYLDSVYWHLRDSNWWPDFRASAEQALYFLSLSATEPTDGVVAMDQEAVRRLLRVVGPVFVPAFSETVSVENLDERLEYHVHTYLREEEASASEAERKEFVDQVSQALLRRLVDAPASQFPAIAQALGSALHDKHLLVYVRDPALQRPLAMANWDGAMLRSPSDYLYVVHANLTPNKINRHIRQQAAYHVESAGKDAVATLRYTLTNTRDFVADDPQRRNHYRDYVRVYVPIGSVLLSSEGFESEPSQAQECGQSVFSGLVEVPAQDTRTFSLEYRLPDGIAQQLRAGTYGLALQHQPGLGKMPWELAIEAHMGLAKLSAEVGTDQYVRPDGTKIAVTDSRSLREVLPSRELSRCEILTGTPIPLSPPDRIRIPSIGVDAETVDLGVTADGIMESPDNGEVVGWYASSARPGRIGNAVMAGHVDWEKQPAVFFDLRRLEAGDRIELVAQDGRAYQYEVAENERFPADQAPIVRLVGPTNRAALTLITCDGVFDPEKGQYLDRRVVRAYLVETQIAQP